MATRFERACANVKAEFDSPAAVVSATDLKREEKIKLLQEWDYDLRLRMVASEENMPAANMGADVRVGDQLQEVSRCLTELGANPSPADGAAKTG